MTDKTIEPQASAATEEKSSTALHWFVWVVFIVAILAIAGVLGLYVKTKQSQSANLQTLDGYQHQISIMQTANNQLQNDIQASEQKSKAHLQKVISQLFSNQHNANKQMAVNSAIYLSRLANLALIINQDPKQAEHLLDVAQSRLQNLPSLDNTRSQIIAMKEKLAAIPTLDINGILMQLGALKKTVLTIKNTPDWSKTFNAHKTKADNATANTANWSVLWNWLKRFMIISDRKTDPNALPTPQHFQSVQDSVFLSLSTAQWAVLHKSQSIFERAIEAAILQLQTVQGADRQVIAKLITQLQQLKIANVDPAYPDLSNLLNTLMTLQSSIVANKPAQPNNVSAPSQQSAKSLSASTVNTKTSKSTVDNKKGLKQITHEVLA